jgi:hypothetical protein
VKRTPTRGVKETLKRNAYKQREPLQGSASRCQKTGIRLISFRRFFQILFLDFVSIFLKLLKPESWRLISDPCVVTSYLLYNGSATWRVQQA